METLLDFIAIIMHIDVQMRLIFKKEEGYVDHPHNELLFWLAEGGIMPFFGLILVAGAWIIMIIRMPLKESLCFLAIILPIIVHTQVEFPFYQSLVHWIVFLTFRIYLINITLILQNTLLTIYKNVGKYQQ